MPSAGSWQAGPGRSAVVPLNPGVSPRIVLKMYGARPVSPREAPEIHALLARLSDRAGLPAGPALEKMERYQGPWVEQIFFPGRRVPEPSLLRTHPRSEERIRRLLDLEPATPRFLTEPRPFVRLRPAAFPGIERRPRWHLNGMWY